MLKCEVLIIGGGLLGCATAFYLADQGVDAILAERGDLNSVASGQNAGSLHFQVERRFLEQGESLSEQAERMIRLNSQAIGDWRGLEERLGTPVGVAMNGGMMVAETEAQVALLTRKAEMEAAANMSAEVIDGDEARSRAPYLGPRVKAALWARDEGQADPKKVTLAFARAAETRGATVLSSAPVRDLARTSGGFVATLARDGATTRVSSQRVVLAAGAWIAQLGAMLNLHLPMFPLGLTMNVTERVAPTIPHLVQHVGRRLSLKQASAGNILIGGGWPSRLASRSDASGFDLSQRPSVLPQSVVGNLRAAVDIVPQIARLNLIRTWTGTVAVSSDQLPIVGEVPRMPGVHVLGGGSAFTLGPTFSRMVAQEIVSGGSAPELADFSPARFEHLNSFMG